jgi:deoxyribose-phosphate aldolase
MTPEDGGDGEDIGDERGGDVGGSDGRPTERPDADPTTIPDDVPGSIEHTVLGPETTWDAVAEVLDAAIRHGMRACVPPCHLDEAVDYAPGVDLATVVAFPHGQARTETKVEAARAAYEAGVAEIDMVANQGYLAAGDDDAYETDIAEVVAAVPIPVKVIVEAPLLDDEALWRACERVAAADAAFLKTATGFADGGATVPDVEVMRRFLPVKASGGIGSWEAAEELFEAGASRIGASSGEFIVEEYREAAGDEY